jgi:DNA-binding beta-propeller fold protein YncE
MFAPGGKAPKRELFRDIIKPNALAVDAFDNLYVGNADVTGGAVNVYRAKSGWPIASFCPDIKQPVSMIFDTTGNLYVANFQSSKVSVFPPLSTVSSGSSETTF